MPAKHGFLLISMYTSSHMAKRDKTLGIHPKSNKSHKTKKRLEVKKTMLAAKKTTKKKK
jgi:hypothetical protein